MSKFCTSCGKPREENAKFCTKCGAAVSSAVSAATAPAESAADEIAAETDLVLPSKNTLVSKTTEEIKKKAKKEVKGKVNSEAKAYLDKAFADVTPACATAGEFTLPLAFTPMAGVDAESLFSVLKSGWRGILSGFKRTLGDKKRLKVVIALTLIWFLVNIFVALGFFPFPVRILSWLTAARGTLIGGTIGKGLVAALLAQIIVEKGMLQSLKGGLGQLTATAKGGKIAYGPLLLGAGFALIVCNLLVSSNLQNTMVCVAGFALAAKALTQNSFLRRLTSALLPKAKDTAVTAVMGGWTLGFALFAAVSLLSGGSNGYILGVLLVLTGGGLMIVGKSKKAVSFLMLILALGLVGCNSEIISQKPGEQKIVTRLCYDKDGERPSEAIHSAMQGGKGAEKNKVPVYITTTEDGKQYVKMSFDGYTNIDYEENIFPGKGPGGSDLDVSRTATTVIESFEVRGEIDGEIEPLKIKIHYTYQTVTNGVVIDQDILLQGTGHFKWQKALRNLELHIYWKYFLKAPETGYYLGGIDGDVEAYDYYVFDLPETVSNQEGLLTSSKIASRADKDAGETGVTIPEALAIILIGGGAALAGAGAGGSGGGGGSGGDDGGKKGKRSRYQMCLKKDFGDAIRYDAQPVTVYARIVEITPEGEEIDRPDLSTALELFSGGGLKVESTAMAGNYMGALVCAESVSGGENPESGVVSIRFSGEGGSFQNNVTFRLIGQPYLSFPEQGHYLTMTLPMLLGDGELYETPFMLNDFLERPVTVKAEVTEGAPLDCTIEETGENQYLLKVQNISVKPEGHQATKQMTYIGIRAENEQELAEDSLNVELYPEGLSIREVKIDESGYVLIGTFDNEATEEFGDVKPTGFVLDFVVPEQSGQGGYKVKVLEPEEFSPTFARLQGTDERTNHLAEKFKYALEETGGNLKEYKFAPQEALVEEQGKPYYLTLPISCTYGEREYKLELPLRLLGGGPGPLAGWEAEFELMKRIVSKVGGINQDVARVLRENGRKMSTAELRLINKRICHDAIVYYTNDAAGYEKIAAELDNLIYYAEWIKWIGDQAFSYLISTYYGDTFDAILSPAKDIFASFLGEAIGTLALGESLDFETLEVGKNVNAAFDNLITNAFNEKMGKKINYKQVCAVVGGFLVWKIAKNLYDNMDKDGKIDLYGAITATTADLTAMGLKSIAGKFFDKALQNKAVQENLNKPLGKWLQDLLPDTTLVKWQNSKDFKMLNFNKSELFKKYLEEIFGMGLTKVTEIDLEAVKGLTELTSGSSIESTLDLSAWPEIRWTTVTTNEDGQANAYAISVNLVPESIGKLCDYLFAQLFGEISLPQEAKTPPVDPPFYSQGSLD